MKFSHSQIQEFLKCERRWELGYLNNLEPKESSGAMVLGSAFHAGIAAALRAWIEGLDPIKQATLTATKYLNDYVVEDSDYGLIKQLFNYYIPKLELGIRYDVLAVEYNFNIQLDEDDEFVGYVDAILYDKSAKAKVLVDWKLREQFAPEVFSEIDGQTHLYAALLNTFKEFDIDDVIMWEFRSKLPSPASISIKNGQPNTGAQSYDTTWEYWCATAPAYIHPEDWRDILQPKMKDESHFMRKVVSPVTEQSTKFTLDNLYMVVEKLNKAILDDSFTAVYNSMTCRFCSFWRLCNTTLRYGGDSTPLINEFYKQKTKRRLDGYTDLF